MNGQQMWTVRDRRTGYRASVGVWPTRGAAERAIQSMIEMNRDHGWRADLSCALQWLDAVRCPGNEEGSWRA